MRTAEREPEAVREHRQGEVVMGMTSESLADKGQPVDNAERGETKLVSILEFFASGHSLNRFEAERLGDHCLNSTVAVLSGHYDLKFIRQREKVPTRFGVSAPVVRYRLADKECARARKLLSVLRGKGRRVGGVK